jgi:hypothetical protein
MFSVWGFVLSNITYIFMIVNDFCLSSVQLCYVVVNVWNLESHIHVTGRCAPREIANGEENLILQALQFQ